MMTNQAVGGQSPDEERLGKWHYVALAGVLLLAVFLRFFCLNQEGYANLYYAAGVKSMLMSWRNFFFASFDPAGFVSIDKPPLGLWIQAASAMVFGFSGWALVLPQALAGTLSVGLVYGLTRRTFGPLAGLAAALTLAVTPISVATNRNNTQDSLLVCLLLLATWVLFCAAERGKIGNVVVAFALVGLGFNIKMLQAYMVLPAFGLFYLLFATVRFWRRVWHLAVACGVMGVISLSWAVLVDMTPADQRPYVGSSQTNSVLELMTGHNGLARLLPGTRGASPVQIMRNDGASAPGGLLPPQGGPLPGGTMPGPPQPGGAFSNETGEPGAFRLFNRQLAGQVLWWLPLAGLGVLLSLWRVKLGTPLSTPQQTALFWSAWVLPQMAFFSVANIFHRYYLEMPAPGLAILTGAGLAALWRDYAGRTARVWLLPVALLATAAFQGFILWPFPAYRAWLAPVVGAGWVISMVGLWMMSKARWGNRGYIGVAFGLLSLLVAPTLWAWIPVWHGGDGWLPFAGPDVLVEQRISPTQAGNERLIAFLQAQHHGEPFLLAMLNARDAAPLILATQQPVMALGGFSGSDPILTPADLEAKIRAGDVRFFLLPGGGPGGGVPPESPAQWVLERCRLVPAAQWSGPGGGPGMQLWDCATAP